MCKLPVRKIPLIGKNGLGKVALVDGDYDGEYFAQFRWYCNPVSGYAYRRGPKDSTIYLHQEVAKPRLQTGLIVDHKNNNRLDCRSCNIRYVTPLQNAVNRTRPTSRKGTFIGVSRNAWKRSGGSIQYGSLWNARHGGNHIGSFSTPEDAARAYDRHVIKLYGGLATINFP